MLKPYYLNECSCGSVKNCKICRSKYHRKYNLGRTEQDLKEDREYARLKYRYMDENDKIAFRKRNREYYQSLSPERKKLRAAREVERKREKRRKLQHDGSC